MGVDATTTLRRVKVGEVSVLLRKPNKRQAAIKSAVAQFEIKLTHYHQVFKLLTSERGCRWPRLLV